MSYSQLDQEREDYLQTIEVLLDWIDKGRGYDVDKVFEDHGLCKDCHRSSCTCPSVQKSDLHETQSKLPADQGACEQRQ